MPQVFRTRLSHFVARRRAKSVCKGYEQIGGTCPQNRRTREQAHELEQRLRARFGSTTGVEFHMYVVNLSSEDGLRQIQADIRRDGIDGVVLLPLYPQCAHATSRAMSANWRSTEDKAGLPPPSTLIHTYAEHPKFAQAISERIDEGLQRFPAHMRHEVSFVFSAPATPLRNHTQHRDAFCEILQATVRNVVAHREAADAGRVIHVALQQGKGLRRTHVPNIEDILERLADNGQSAVLVIPATEVADRVETVYGLDVLLRERAAALGIEYFEVTRGLNGHPLFIDALAESVALQLRSVDALRDDSEAMNLSGGEDASDVIELLLAQGQKPAAGRSKAA